MSDGPFIPAYFTKVARNYANYRPSYPSTFFKYLTTLSPKSELAWDVATGNGQAAYCLAEFFERVVGTDLSEGQLREAKQKPNIHYINLPAEMSDEQCEANGFFPHTIDVITCATAIHWIDVHKFFHVAKKLLKPNGILAIFIYDCVKNGDEKIDAVLQDYLARLLPIMKLSTDNSDKTYAGYQQLHFPLDHVIASWDENAPKFNIEVSWSLEDFRGFLETWSSTMLAREKWGYNPVDEVIEKISPNWGSEEKRTFTFPMIYRIGKNN